MAERAPSQTAIGVAWLRAAHQCLDAPRILDDPVILQLFGDAADRIRRDPERFQTPGARALRAHVVLRSRYAEDSLHAAVLRGVAQYVILGAGLDTFAYRQPGWAHELRIFEVDQPASQAEKREALAAARIALPANLTLVPVDFERESLAEGLRLGGGDLTEPVFVAWLGVTMYLTRGVVEDVLRFIASLPRGSEVVFTFAQPRAEASRDGTPSLADRAAAVGEPWLSYFTPAELEALLRDVGFSTVELLTPAEARSRYPGAGESSLPVPRRVSIARAVV